MERMEQKQLPILVQCLWNISWGENPANCFLQPLPSSGEKLEPEGCTDPFTWDITSIPRDPSRGQMKS